VQPTDPRCLAFDSTACPLPRLGRLGRLASSLLAPTQNHPWLQRTADLVDNLVTAELDDCSHWANQDRYERAHCIPSCCCTGYKPLDAAQPQWPTIAGGTSPCCRPDLVNAKMTAFLAGKVGARKCLCLRWKAVQVDPRHQC
jgi:hypothetical protein